MTLNDLIQVLKPGLNAVYSTANSNGHVGLGDLLEQINSGSSGSISGSIDVTQIPRGSAPNTIFGDANLTFDPDAFLFTVAGSVIPKDDGAYNLGNAGGNGDGPGWNRAYVNDHVGVGLFPAGNNLVFIESHSGSPGSDKPWILMQSGGGTIKLEGRDGFLNLISTAAIAATPASDVLTFTNGPAGTAGNPDIYLVLMKNGVRYAFPGFQLP